MEQEQKPEKLMNKRDGLAVHGYIRENFDKKCWIHAIIKIIHLYMSRSGSLYVFGNGEYGQLGIEPKKYGDDICKVPTICPPFTDNNAYKVSAGRDHTLILDADGNVWACGLGTYGALGNGDIEDLFVPTKLNLVNRIISASAGEAHSLLLCENGWVQSFGWSCYGQLGHGDLNQSLVPKTIEKLKKYKIVQISAGDMHSAVLTSDGDLFCFGDNENGQCGVGKEKGKNILSPTKVHMDDEIEFVDCGRKHSLLITRKGLMYSFGAGQYGQLGHGDDKENKYVPALIESLEHKKIKLCAAGDEHSICIDKDGTVWTFGRDDSGQCGLALYAKSKECAAGGDSSCVIAEDGSLYVFGSNSKCQLGLKKECYFTPTKLSIPYNMTVQSISMGWTHTALIV